MENNIEIKSKKKLFKTIFQITFFSSLTFLAIFYILYTTGDIKQIFINISQVKFFPFLLVLLLVFSCSFFDGVSISFLCKEFDKKYSLLKGIENSLTSNFVAVFNKTAATVIQSTTLNKQGIKSSRSVSIITMNFLIYQFSLVIYSIFSFFFSYNTIKNINVSVIPGLKVSVLSLIGLSINTGIFIIIILLAFSKRLHRYILTTFIDILSKLHIIKNPDEKRNLWAIKIITYHVVCSRLLKQYKVTILCVILNLAKLFILNTIPFLTFWTLQANTYFDVKLDFYKLYRGSNFLSLISVYIPSGAPEIAFKDIFTFLLGNNNNAELLATSGILVWRLLTFFFPFVVGGLFYLLYKGEGKNLATRNTMKIYDLQLSSISEESKSDKKVYEYVTSFEASVNKKKRNIVLLNKQQVIDSFENIRNEIKKNTNKKEENTKIDKRQKETLINVYNEVKQIIANNNELNKEIEKKAQEELNIQKEKAKRKSIKKNNQN